MTRILFLAFVMLAGQLSMAQKTDGPAKIQDNSFLIEEAYNQDPGVIQHIQSYQYLSNKTWNHTFTEEWPAPGQTHQLSATIPFGHMVDESTSSTGIGDVALNYRYQLYLQGPLAIAPRASLLLPTGDYKKGFGAGGIGLQTNLPLSWEIGENFVTHWNLGATLTPAMRSPLGPSALTVGYNYGASLIWLNSATFNTMLEIYSVTTPSVDENKHISRKEDLFINPGIRVAINYASGLQIVPGVSAPIGIGPSSGIYGILAYLSFEHPAF